MAIDMATLESLRISELYSEYRPVLVEDVKINLLVDSTLKRGRVRHEVLWFTDVNTLFVPRLFP